MLLVDFKFIVKIIVIDEKCGNFGCWRQRPKGPKVSIVWISGYCDNLSGSNLEYDFDAIANGF